MHKFIINFFFLTSIFAPTTTAFSLLPTNTSKSSTLPSTTQTPFRTPSHPILNCHCKSTADCQKNVTTFSRCYFGQCICSLGYQLVNGSCLKVNCIFNSDCARLFPNSACDAGSGRCVCDYFHELHLESQTCSERNLLNLTIFLVFASFLFASVFLVLGIFFKVTLVDGLLECLTNSRRRSGYRSIN